MQTSLLVRVPLWKAQALAQNGTLTSPSIDCRRFDRLESLMFQITAVANPQVKIQYAVSEDDVTFGAFTDNADLLANTNTLASPKGENALSLPNPLANFVKFKLTELNIQATTVTSFVLLARER